MYFICRECQKLKSENHKGLMQDTCKACENKLEEKTVKTLMVDKE